MKWCQIFSFSSKNRSKKQNVARYVGLDVLELCSSGFSPCSLAETKVGKIITRTLKLAQTRSSFYIRLGFRWQLSQANLLHSKFEQFMPRGQPENLFLRSNIKFTAPPPPPPHTPTPQYGTITYSEGGVCHCAVGGGIVRGTGWIPFTKARTRPEDPAAIHRSYVVELDSAGAC